MSEKIITCLNGQFMLAHRAAVPVSDRGFRFGDGVFETIRLTRGVPYQFAEHMARLHAGLADLRIDAPLVDWAAITRRMIARNNAREGFLRIAISRGSGSRGYLPHPPAMPATWVVEYLPPIAAPEQPLVLWLSAIARTPPQCLPTGAKLAQGVNSTLAMLDARANGCDEALQLSPSGMIAEAASANIFWMKGDDVFTPSLETGCVAGTTRAAILRLSPIPIRAVQAGISALEKADAVFLTNTRLGVCAVRTLQPMGWAFNQRHPVITNFSSMLGYDRAKAAKQDWA